LENRDGANFFFQHCHLSLLHKIFFKEIGTFITTESATSGISRAVVGRTSVISEPEIVNFGLELCNYNKSWSYQQHSL